MKDLKDECINQFFYISRHPSPWPDDARCNSFLTSSNKTENIPLVFVAAFPTSGDIWLRHMIEGVAGILTEGFKDHISGTKI